MAQFARANAALADKVTAVFHPTMPTAAHQLGASPPVPAPLERRPARVAQPTPRPASFRYAGPPHGWQLPFNEPWRSLVAEAHTARDRIHPSCTRVTGAAAGPAQAARAESTAGAAAAADVAWRAAQVEAAVGALQPARVRERLAQFESLDDVSADLEATKDSLRHQVATAERMEATKR